MSDTSIRIAALSLDIVDGNPEENINKIEPCLHAIADDLDILVLPELFSTGYIDDHARAYALAEPDDGYTMTRIRALASAYDTAVCGSFLAKEDEALYNRGFFVEPDGKSTFYDKRHLFCLSQESKIVQHGRSEMPKICFRGWNISLAVCYDLRFPVWLRNTQNYDVLIIPANWPDKRAFAWKQLLIARAIENQACVVGCNRSGTDRFGRYDGLTFAYDCKGEERGMNYDIDGCKVLIVGFLKYRLDDFREIFPAWKDADDFEITL